MLAVVLVPAAVTFYTDWLWFGETGFGRVFLRTLTAQSQLGAAVMGLAFVTLFVNVLIALRTLAPRDWVLVTREGPISISLDRRRVQPVATALVGVVAVLMGLWASSQWQAWLMFQHAQPFGERDPILGHDISFYVFRLGFLELVRGFLMVLVLASALAAGAIYTLAGALNWNRGARIGGSARRHLAALAACAFLLLAFGAYLDVPELLIRPAGIVHGVANVDDAVRIPALRVLMVAALVGAGLAVFQTVTVRLWPIGAAVLLYLAVAIVGSAAAGVMHRFVIAPNEQARETPYIEHNIAATRKAFAIDRVEEREVTGDTTLTRSDIDANTETLGNVRLWDHQPLLQTFAQIQEIRTYYDFVSVHNDRYRIDGQYRQIMLSARELNSESLPNRNWINERLTFTHGYGVTLGPVNQVTPEGLPVLFIKDLPPQSTVDLKIDEPSIYYGQLSNDHVFVKTRAREFHYPRGEDNVYTSVRRDRGRPDLEPVPPRALQHPLPILQGAAQRGHHQREPRDVLPAAVGARGAYRSVPALRRGSVSGHLERPAGVGAGRLHDQWPVSVFDACIERHQLHPQFGQGDGRRVSRHGALLPDRRSRSDRDDAQERVPGPVPAARRDARGHAVAAALPGGHLRAAGGGLRHVPHDQPVGLLQQRGSLGGAGDRRRRAPSADAAGTTRSCACPANVRRSSSRCCRSRPRARTTWRRGWWRAATARITAG